MGVFFISKNGLMINEQITDKEVRLVDDDGSMRGIISSDEARKIATSKNLDLVKVSPNANPCVCKIMDYGKYVFEKAKKEKDARKKQKVITIKEIRLSSTIDDHDFNFKIKNAIKFLKEGDKVKVSVRFRGREINYSSHGLKILNRFAEVVGEEGSIDKPPKLEGRNMVMILNPKQ